jgi:hemolysin-activating ACP:hemolysin acyltransferase
MTAPRNTDLVNGTLAATPAATAVASGASDPPVPTPEMRAGIEKFRQAIQLSVGQIVLATMNLPRYRHQAMADLAHLFVTPLMRDRVAIARKVSKSPDGAGGTGEETVVGIALWATVSDAVDAKITEQIKAGVFPVRLGPDDWTSGETVWLLDVVAHDRQQATSVLANFRQLAGGRAVKIAPLVARLIDPAVAAKLRGAAAETREEKRQAPAEIATDNSKISSSTRN